MLAALLYPSLLRFAIKIVQLIGVSNFLKVLSTSLGVGERLAMGASVALLLVPRLLRVLLPTPIRRGLLLSCSPHARATREAYAMVPTRRQPEASRCTIVTRGPGEKPVAKE